MIDIVHDESVDDVEGTYARERTNTTDAHIGHRTGFRTGGNAHARHLALQHLADVGGRILLRILHAHHRYGSREVGFLLRTVTNHHDVVERLAVLGEGNHQLRLAAHLYNLGNVANVRHRQLGIGSHVESKLTIKVGGHTIGDVIDLHDTHSNEGLVINIDDSTAHSNLLCQCDRHKEQHEQNCQN